MDALILEPWMILLFFSFLLLGCCYGSLIIGKEIGKKIGEKLGIAAGIEKGQQTLLLENALLKQKNQNQQQQHLQQQQYNQELNLQQQQAFENLSHKIFNEKQQQSKLGLDAILHPFKDQLEGLRKKSRRCLCS
jgi:DNA recombination protein RmuC